MGPSSPPHLRSPAVHRPRSLAVQYASPKVPRRPPHPRSLAVQPPPHREAPGPSSPPHARPLVACYAGPISPQLVMAHPARLSHGLPGHPARLTPGLSPSRKAAGLLRRCHHCGAPPPAPSPPAFNPPHARSPSPSAATLRRAAMASPPWALACPRRGRRRGRRRGAWARRTGARREGCGS